MKGVPVVAATMEGAGPVSAVAAELRSLEHALADPEKNLVPQLGILAVEIDKNIAAMIDDLRDPYGIIVAARAAGTAAEVPLTTGDVIRSLNGQPMTTLDRLRAALKASPPGAPIVLQIQREGKLQFVTFTPE